MKSKLDILKDVLKTRILVFDGAMGTLIQRHMLTEKDFRGERFKEHPKDLKGNNEILNLTQPEIICDIHRAYLDAGADIISTNTFNGTAISLADYGTQDLVYEVNHAAAQNARTAVDEYNLKDKTKPRFVAGSLGPTNKTLSISPDVNDPGFRSITFEEMVKAYYEQAEGLIEGGADILLIETIFDTLNAKAAIYAVEEYLQGTGKEIPLIISGTIVDLSGRTLSGQTTEAFFISISHAKNILSVGLNCSLGAAQMRPFLEELSNIAPYYVHVYPNAGLPNEMGEYDETAETTSSILKEFGESGFYNLVGGCCGTTPGHICKVREVVDGK